MDKEKFWETIDDAREETGHWKKMYDPLLKNLSALEPQDIIHWQQIFDEYRGLSYKDKLWGAASVINNGCSDDGFEDFRGWLIAQGKEVYLNALTDPGSLADLETVRAFGREVRSSFYTPLKGYHEPAEFEAILYIASYAYENRTGNEDEYYDKLIHIPPLSKKEKADISDEITYAPDIDVKWFDRDASGREIDERLKNLFPGIYRMFDNSEAPIIDVDVPSEAKHHGEKESVLEKIREAKAAEKSTPSHQKQGQGRSTQKKSHEQEV